MTDSSVFLLGLVGNCLVVAVVFRVPRMRTVTNYFIVIITTFLYVVLLFKCQSNKLRLFYQIISSQVNIK